MEDNDSYDTIDICKNESLLKIIEENIITIFDICNSSYISIIYYDTVDDTYNTDKIYITNLIDDELINKKQHEYLSDLSCILYEKTLNKKCDNNDMSFIKKEILNNFNITNETYCNCIMSMINDDIDKTSDKSQKNILIQTKKLYNELLNL